MNDTPEKRHNIDQDSIGIFLWMKMCHNSNCSLSHTSSFMPLLWAAAASEKRNLLILIISLSLWPLEQAPVTVCNWLLPLLPSRLCEFDYSCLGGCSLYDCTSHFFLQYCSHAWSPCVGNVQRFSKWPYLCENISVWCILWRVGCVLITRKFVFGGNVLLALLFSFAWQANI